MQRYTYCCVGTEGDAVFDTTGLVLPSLRRARAEAVRVAARLMARGVGVDWSGWHVEVYDAKGRRVAVRAFADVRL